MFEGHDQAIFDLLAERRLVEPASLRAAFDEHRATGKPLARMLLDLGLLEKSALLQAVADHIGCDYAGDLPATLSSDAIALVEGGMARTYAVAPIASDGFSISVAAVDPFNPNLVNDLTFALERDVRISVADPERVQRPIRQQYGEEDISLDAALDDLQVQVGDTADEVLSGADIEQLAGQPPIIPFVNLLLAPPIRDNPSDLHPTPL